MDDHRRVLDAVSTMLEDEFDVVGATTDGRQALHIAQRVHPDVIVLDVDMPFDGFQTIRSLEQGGLPSTPVVFLSMHDAEDIVAEAFRCGGRGYVLKSRAGRDLPSALDQALLGRVFVPSLTTLFKLANGGVHAMQLYQGLESLLDGAAVLFDCALRRGDAACVIGDTWVRAGLSDRLRGKGWSVDGSSGHPRLRGLDVADFVNRCLPDGAPDTDQIAGLVHELDEYRRAVTDAPTSRLVVFGNTLASLSVDDNANGMVALERIWTTVTHGLPFISLCAYATSCFHDAKPSVWSNVSTEHVVLSHANDV